MVEISREPFGEIEGRLIDRFTLANRHGLRVEVITYGGIIRAIWAPDRDGQLANVTLGFADLAGYLRTTRTSAASPAATPTVSPMAASPSTVRPISFRRTMARTTSTAGYAGSTSASGTPRRSARRMPPACASPASARTVMKAIRGRYRPE
jgi:hypothetical protein